mmetsp:Transcript_89199/g.252296  ORF Transcript_89199/g.252296 Transcript_89199/m.252296 type:complete len:305 (+) Transcript_89199:172-1086(+)
MQSPLGLATTSLRIIKQFSDLDRSATLWIGDRQGRGILRRGEVHGADLFTAAGVNNGHDLRLALLRRAEVLLPVLRIDRLVGRGIPNGPHLRVGRAFLRCRGELEFRSVGPHLPLHGRPLHGRLLLGKLGRRRRLLHLGLLKCGLLHHHVLRHHGRVLLLRHGVGCSDARLRRRREGRDGCWSGHGRAGQRAGRRVGLRHGGQHGLEGGGGRCCVLPDHPLRLPEQVVKGVRDVLRGNRGRFLRLAAPGDEEVRLGLGLLGLVDVGPQLYPRVRNRDLGALLRPVRRVGSPVRGELQDRISGGL